VKGSKRTQFRRGQREDADLIVRLIDMSSQGGIGAHYRQLYGEDIDWRHRARLEIAAGGDELGFQNAVFVMVGGEVAGGMVLNALRSTMVLTSPADSRAGLIERLIARMPGALFIRELAVFPMFRGRGIGRLMIEFAGETAAARNIETVTLTVNADNAPARALYDSAGFAEQASARIEDHVVLLLAMKLSHPGQA
jgi:ribosomal protein S18 acetylase RimI-like enzyme